MSDENQPKVKKSFALPNMPPRDTFMAPEVMGAMKKHPLHMSLDELIDYRASGVKPKYIIDDALLFQLGKIGASMKTVCQMLGITDETLTSNPVFLGAWQNGRSELAAKNRAKIAERALSGDLDAMKYLDKLIGGDIEQTNLNVTLTAQPLKEVSTEQLLEFTLPKKDDDVSEQ